MIMFTTLVCLHTQVNNVLDLSPRPEQSKVNYERKRTLHIIIYTRTMLKGRRGLLPTIFSYYS